MLEQLMYINHLGEKMSFGNDGVFVNRNDLRDFTWTHNAKNNRISDFSRGVVKKSLNVVLMCASEEEGISKRNALFEICEKDVLANKHGKIVIGDYYLKCFVTGSKKAEYQYNKRYMTLALTVVTDFPAWIKETTIAFRKADSPLIESESGDYPHDYPYDYASTFLNNTIINSDFVATNFKMTIYGSCTAPELYVSGHKYAIASEILPGEHVVIDSTAKTVELIRRTGERENRFNERNRESYVFEKIPPGENEVTWEGDFGFDITLLEERSEPKWT